MKTNRTPQEEIKRLKALVVAKTLAMKQHAKGHRRLHRKLKQSQENVAGAVSLAKYWKESSDAYKGLAARCKEKISELKKQNPQP